MDESATKSPVSTYWTFCAISVYLLRLRHTLM
jgi:hypothetical protein